MLTLKSVCAGYQGHDVVHDINCCFETGHSYSLLGPNGCGKTTLIRAMANLINYSGEIQLDGVEMNSMKRREIARHMAVMSQITTLYFPYTVYDTVMLGRYQHLKRTLFGQPTQKDREIVRMRLEAGNLWELRDKQLDQLSGGQRQRVFLAQALVQEPEIILLDEPTNHLDVRHQIELIDALHEWTADGRHSVIGVFHDVNLALRLSDEMLFMKNGRLMGAGKFGDIACSGFLKSVYDMDVTRFMQESFEKWKDVL